MRKRTLRFSFLLSSAIALSAQPGPPMGPGMGPGQGGDGVWQRDANFGEALTFDRCLAHQPQDGTYHNHVQPVCLRAQLGDNLEVASIGRTGPIYREKASDWTHSPILGWSYDGYPIYGPYAYSDPADPSSAVKRMQSSFRLRTITQRASLPDWTLAVHNGVPQQLPSNLYGPDVSDVYPLGRYVEDYDYVAGLGDLDQYNGRFAVTPEFPGGTYAYFVTINDDGSPAFPYVMNLEYYGTPANARNINVPGSAQDYFANGAYQQAASTDPQLASWLTQNSRQLAQVVSGWDPSAGPATTWPASVPAGGRSNGGTTTPALADMQRIRVTTDAVYVNSNDLASYVMGPWFGLDPGGVFQNWPSAQNMQAQIPRNPTAPAVKRMTTGGPIGMLVNGVALFNPLDMASYSNSAKADAGPPIAPAVAHVSTASGEAGPIAPGSLVTAAGMYGAMLVGGTVTVTDSAGKAQQAAVISSSAAKINYRMPTDMATGIANVVVVANGARATGSINVVDAYPNLFPADAPDTQAALKTASNQMTLSIYGSGMGNGDPSGVTATIGGEPATVIYAGADGSAPGLDRYDLVVPADLAGQGAMDVVVKVNGRASNPVSITL